MAKKTKPQIISTLLLTGLLTLAFNTQPSEATATIYIRADGTIDPQTAPISTTDNVTYALTNNIYEPIIIEKNNIIIDGAGHTLEGTGTGAGIDLTGRSNVTIKNTQIKRFNAGISLTESDHNTISGNNINNNEFGVLERTFCAFNTISENNITANRYGVAMGWRVRSTIRGNSITNNWCGISHGFDCQSTIHENTIMNNYYGIDFYLYGGSSIYHNNFVSNTIIMFLVEDSEYSIITCIWDDGYPSGGNYWSDYNDVDIYSGPDQNAFGIDGIWDHSYVIDVNNRDRYPLVKPWPTVSATVDVAPDTLNLRSMSKWIVAYIELPKWYNTANIDASTISLNGTISPVLDSKYSFATNPNEYLVDHNNDGTLERMLKFDTAKVKPLLRVGEATLTLTGRVNNVPFKGSDTIRITKQ